MNEVRVDKWLWAMRVFKTRTVATEACKKGRVYIGNVIAKPSRTVKVGDVVNVRKPRVPNFTSKSELDLLEVVKISGFIDRRKGLGRPTKREGRELAQFTESMSDGWDMDFLDDIDDED